MAKNPKGSSPFPGEPDRSPVRYPRNYQDGGDVTMPPAFRDGSDPSDSGAPKMTTVYAGPDPRVADMVAAYAGPEFYKKVVVLHIDAYPEKGERQHFDVPVIGDVTIGRGLANLVNIDDVCVSQRHVKIHEVSGALQILDRDSTNGTWLNGRKLSAPAALKSGDEVRVGRTRLVIRF